MLVCTNFLVVSVLHPRHKLKYFKKHNWEEVWVNAASDIVHKEFDRSYAHMGFEGSGDGVQLDGDEVVS
jgi:hypothetical protein